MSDFDYFLIVLSDFPLFSFSPFSNDKPFSKLKSVLECVPTIAQFVMLISGYFENEIELAKNFPEVGLL